MKVILSPENKITFDTKIIFAFSKKLASKEEKWEISPINWPKEIAKSFDTTPGADNFTGKKGATFSFFFENITLIALGLGEEAKLTREIFRRELSKCLKKLGSTSDSLAIPLEGVPFDASIITEAALLGAYSFKKYFSKSEKLRLKTVYLTTNKPTDKMQTSIEEASNLCESINLCRDFVNEPPNVLNSESYTKLIEKDVKDNLSNVKIKILGEAELKKEGCGLFLAVNAGSCHEPRLIHLTYTPKNLTKKSAHVALVGKGLTFDSGGFNLKPSASVKGMKYDMAGSATVYAAFRSAVLNKLPVKITLVLGLTDNLISSHAFLPDSIIKSRNGKTVEIGNTDAEGRLVLADCLSYTGSEKPDLIIDVATLTGAIVAALGEEVCGLFSNNETLSKNLLASAKDADEYLWSMPLIEEYREDIKSKVADLYNMGNKSFGGASKAAVFLEAFIENDTPWAHLDIAGVAANQKHLPYCPADGGSGIMVRTLYRFLVDHA